MEGNHYTTMQLTRQGYTLCKPPGHWSQIWRGMEASHCSLPLAITRIGINEAMNVLYEREIKREDADIARTLNTLSSPKCNSPTDNNWLA